MLFIDDEFRLLTAYALISLIRIIVLGIPTFFTLRLYDFVPVYAAAILGAIIVLGSSFGLAGGASQFLALGTLLDILRQVNSSKILADNRPDMSAKLTILYFAIIVPPLCYQLTS